MSNCHRVGRRTGGRLFVRTLTETSPLLAPCIHLAQWPGGTAGLDAALCRGVDLVLAYGGQSTLQSLQALCPSSAEFHGYGHRVSFGLVTAGAASDAVARGFARDVLLYDQGGCLSPHTIFVQGPQAAVLKFAAQLADALLEAARQAPAESPRPTRGGAGPAGPPAGADGSRDRSLGGPRSAVDRHRQGRAIVCGFPHARRRVRPAARRTTGVSGRGRALRRASPGLRDRPSQFGGKR